MEDRCLPQYADGNRRALFTGSTENCFAQCEWPKTAFLGSEAVWTYAAKAEIMSGAQKALHASFIEIEAPGKVILSK